MKMHILAATLLLTACLSCNGRGYVFGEMVPNHGDGYYRYYRGEGEIDYIGIDADMAKWKDHQVLTEIRPLLGRYYEEAINRTSVYNREYSKTKIGNIFTLCIDDEKLSKVEVSFEVMVNEMYCTYCVDFVDGEFKQIIPVH